MRLLWTFLWLLITVSISKQQCGPCEEAIAANSGYRAIHFEESYEHIVNPGRGFTEIINGRASSFTPLTISGLEQLRQQDGLSVVWRQYILDAFVDSDITQTFIDLIHEDLRLVKDARFTAIIRFMYTDQGRNQAPYGDATKSWMLAHISQLSPVFFEHEDVIDAVQAGLIGIWGEWYYTTDFGDPNEADWSDPDNVRGMTPQNWQDRREVLQHLLDNTPKSIAVQVRVPQYKREIIQDYTPTTMDDMRQQNDKARIGQHNDCFLASDTDFGTYVDKAEEYPYLMSDNLWSSMGGETCAIAANGRHRCATAIQELEELRWTYVNQAYNADVLQVWKDEGCYPEIHRRLGYRLVIQRAVLPDDVYGDGQFCYHIELQNKGYAGALKDREIFLVLRNQGGELFGARLESGAGDFRAFVPGDTFILQGQVFLPEKTPPGQYQVLMMISEEKLSSMSDYNILFANVDVPEFDTGFNDLNHTLQVMESSDNSGDPACPHFSQMVAPEVSKYDRLYCGLGGCDELEYDWLPYSVENPSFEEDGGWTAYMDGFTYTTHTASHGLRSISVNNGAASQVFIMPPGTLSFHAQADSRNTGVVGSASDDYSIYCDIKYSDHSWSYGHAAQFTVGDDTWHVQSLIVQGNQVMSELWCYTMFRNYGSGTAYFDHFQLWTSTKSNPQGDQWG